MTSRFSVSAQFARKESFFFCEKFLQNRNLNSRLRFWETVRKHVEGISERLINYLRLFHQLLTFYRIGWSSVFRPDSNQGLCAYPSTIFCHIFCRGYTDPPSIRLNMKFNSSTVVWEWLRAMRERCRICGETVPAGVRLLHLASAHRIDCATFTVDPVREAFDPAIIDYYEEPVFGEWRTVRSSKPMEEWSIPELLENALHVVDLLLKCLRDMLKSIKSLATRLKKATVTRNTIRYTSRQAIWNTSPTQMTR